MASVPERVRVFIDADVLIAGAASGTGASRLVLQVADLGLIDAVSSDQARREVERNLRAKLPAALPAFGVLADTALRWVPDPSRKQAGRFVDRADEKDLPILVAAIRASCSALLTFNTKDYRPQGLIVVETPGEFVRRLRESLATLAE